MSLRGTSLLRGEGEGKQMNVRGKFEEKKKEKKRRKKEKDSLHACAVRGVVKQQKPRVNGRWRWR